jgi:hypothetical protein
MSDVPKNIAAIHHFLAVGDGNLTRLCGHWLWDARPSSLKRGFVGRGDPAIRGGGSAGVNSAQGWWKNLQGPFYDLADTSWK